MLQDRISGAGKRGRPRGRSIGLRAHHLRDLGRNLRRTAMTTTLFVFADEFHQSVRSDSRLRTREFGSVTTALVLMLLCSASALAQGTDESLTPIALPGGEGGIGFDDLGFSQSLGKVLVPAGRTGALDLVDPETKQIVSIGGFASTASFGGGHGEGITSVDEGRGILFVTDRSARRLDVVDPRGRSVIASAALSSGPDYVRFVSETNQVWVTQPRAQAIEVFDLPTSGTPKPIHSTSIAVPGGPESLIIDHTNHRAYTHLWTDTTVAIDLSTRKVVARWANGCKGSRGIAIDEKRRLLFAGCEEGKVTILDLATGGVLGSASSGRGVDIIAYNQRLAHLYLPGAKSATMAIVGISQTGAATVLKTVETTQGAHCATADNRDQVYVCDPAGGRILVFNDLLPPNR